MIVREAQLADAEAIARVHVASWRTTYRGIVPDDYLERLSVDQRIEMWQGALDDRQRTVEVFVAQDDADRVVGFSSCGPNRDYDRNYDGELFAVYLLQSYQGRGLGRQLVRNAARRLADSGFRAMMLWVLAANPARAFYSALSGQELRTKSVEIGGVPLEEVAYGWPDLGIFSASPESLR
jgi:ribosomal protein S18 acetylase RimI-like enzyme